MFTGQSYTDYAFQNLKNRMTVLEKQKLVVERTPVREDACEIEDPVAEEPCPVTNIRLA